ncbi:hypothetical protein CCR75_008098 [Bremia lactucae]|uniref:Uncharacterized protein n=1 Tax=Bremia lactucae TaxID=4779 RepID=A0A976FJY0_BRELC|nr:hypothetical protein CCR75_008098 [Bremia lactucae]
MDIESSLTLPMFRLEWIVVLRGIHVKLRWARRLMTPAHSIKKKSSRTWDLLCCGTLAADMEVAYPRLAFIGFEKFGFGN